MAAGSISWRQRVDIRFEGDIRTTDILSSIAVLDDTAKYSIGNAHIFFMPRDAANISLEESLRKTGREEVTQLGVHSEAGSQIVRRDDPDQLQYFPSTKHLRGVGQLMIVLGYDCPANHPPIASEFNVEIDFTAYLAEYLESLGCPRQSEYLNDLVINISPPEGCTWAVDRGRLLEQWSSIAGIRVDHDLTRIGSTDISVRLLPVGIISSTRVRFSIPCRRTVEQRQQALDAINTQYANRPVEDCVVFVCDLRGSSDQTSGGLPPADLLRFRQIWRRESVAPFRMVKIIGDMAIVISSPEIFRRKGLAEILDLYGQTLNLGVRVRGGFHFGQAEATGDTTARMSGDRVGDEFLGDAINRGAKIGDYKDNQEGLIASSEFLRWLNPTEALSTPWQTRKFGAWEVELHRVDMGSLRRSASHNSSIGQSKRQFAERLIKRVAETGSRLIVGLDPDIERFPKFLRDRIATDPSNKTLEDIIVAFHETVIDATAPHVAAFKPQSAFYEQYGLAGMSALQRTIAYVRAKDIPVILDGKRNDIEHTASAYARAWLSRYRPVTGQLNDWRVDAITVNGYLGVDGIKPFLDADPDAGLFVLAKTSNPSSGEFQDLLLQDGGEANFERMARLSESWGSATKGESGYSRVGLVVGATYPNALEQLRKAAPSALFLMPGIGAQGAGFKAVALGCDSNGFGAFASASRSVLYGFDDARATTKDTWRSAVTESASREAKRITHGVAEALNAR